VTELKDLTRCAIHTMTTKPWSLAECIAGYSRLGIRGISVWTDAIEKIGAPEAGRMLRDAGMHVPALVRGGFFFSAGAIDENLRRIDDAKSIGAEMVVLVVGAVPGMDLKDARKRVADAIAAILPHAEATGVKLAIEPLHPMYAADRSCINRLTQARQICEQLQNPMLGIAVDVYHVWWDPDLKSEIALAGRQKALFAFHVCDWRLPTRHMLNDRGLMGQGCINLRTIRDWTEQAGFQGPIEVEIFSEEFWAMDQAEYLELIAKAYRSSV
jgi:sugar phosphate isomerase/epimerase